MIFGEYGYLYPYVDNNSQDPEVDVAIGKFRAVDETEAVQIIALLPETSLELLRA